MDRIKSPAFQPNTMGCNKRVHRFIAVVVHPLIVRAVPLFVHHERQVAIRERETHESLCVRPLLGSIQDHPGIGNWCEIRCLDDSDMNRMDKPPHSGMAPESDDSD